MQSEREWTLVTTSPLPVYTMMRVINFIDNDRTELCQWLLATYFAVYDGRLDIIDHHHHNGSNQQ